ncbi:MAG: (2Fe-2S) ferredoxin domain-containing protein [Clostridia bacterium]|nr:(2Fe-2S) ferredoxin domain-containing protein [Clostridia bacterium]
MKSIQELEAIRQRTLNTINMRKDNQNTRVVVGMATCGIAAGARPVLLKFMDEVANRNLSGVTVSQTGCIGFCRLEPIVEVYSPDKEKVTYVKVNPDMVGRIITDHIVNGKVVEEYTIGYYEKNNK